MDIKEINSKINLVTARISQIQESELFSEEEKERRTAPERKQLEELQQLKADIAPSLDVNNAEIM